MVKRRRRPLRPPQRLSDRNGPRIFSQPSQQSIARESWLRVTPQNRLLRWFAVATYTIAILGALIVPHAHHKACSHGSCGASGANACSHAHHGDHHHAGAEACGGAHNHHDDSGEHKAPIDDECAICRFLAQPLQFAVAVQLSGQAEWVTRADPMPTPLRRTPPPLCYLARGPPASMA